MQRYVSMQIRLIGYIWLHVLLGKPQVRMRARLVKVRCKPGPRHGKICTNTVLNTKPMPGWLNGAFGVRTEFVESDYPCSCLHCGSPRGEQNEHVRTANTTCQFVLNFVFIPDRLQSFLTVIIASKAYDEHLGPHACPRVLSRGDSRRSWLPR